MSDMASPELPDNSYLGDAREAALIRAVARHREVAPQMYQGIGLTVLEQRAMEAVITPLINEVERFRGYCEEWARKCEAISQ